MKRLLMMSIVIVVGLCLAVKWLVTSSTYATGSPTANALTFKTVTSNKIESNLTYKYLPAFTLETWVNPSSYPSTRFYLLAGSSTGNNVSAGLVLLPNKKFAFHEYATENKDRNVIESTTTIPLNTWTHVAAVYDHGVVQLYVNGVLEGTLGYGLITTNTIPWKNSLVIGSPSSNSSSDPDGSYRSFDGKIADVRVWDIARTASEISGTKDSELTGNELGLIGYFKLDPTTTGTVWDQSPNDNHGTASGFTSPVTLSKTSGDTKTSLSLTWNNNVGNASAYTLKRDGTTLYTGMNGSFTSTGLTPNTAYTYTLQVESPNGSSLPVTKTIRTPLFNVVASPVTFDGIDDYFDIPYLAIQRPQTAFTFEGKVYIDPKQNQNKLAMIVDTTQGSDSNQGWYLAFDDRTSTKSLVFHAYDTNGGGREATLSNAITEEGWYHVAVSLNASATSDQMKLYLNNTLVATQTNTGGLGTNPLSMEIGNSLSGMIVESRLWNSERSASQLTSTLETNLTGTETGLIGLWKFNGAVTGKTYDQTVQKNHATGNNFKLVMTTTYAGGSDTTVSYTLPTFAGMTNKVERDGVTLNSNAGASFSDSGLTSDTTYTYTMYATNSIGETDRFVKTIRTIKPPSTGLSFDGVDDVTEIPAASHMNINGSSITQEAWVRLPVYQTRAFLNKEGQFEMQITSDGTLQAAYSVKSSNIGWYWISSGYKLPLNTWIHVASSYDGVRVKFYVNGTLVADVDHTHKGVLNSSSNILRFGARDSNGDGAADGFSRIDIASVRIWNTVRTEQEIRDNMNQKLAGNLPGLMAAYYMNPLTNGTVYDATTYANHGTVNGMNPLTQLTPGNVTTTSIPLTWNGIAGANTYELKKDGITLQNNSSTSFTDTAAEDEKHDYTLSAYSLDGISSPYTVSIRTKHSKGLLFNGTNNYASIDPKGYTYTGQAFTMESRFKPEMTSSTNAGRTEEIVFGWIGWHQGILYDSMSQQVCMQMTYVRKSDNVIQRDRMCTPLAAGTEAFVSVTFDPASRNTKVYVDGVLKIDHTSTYTTSTHTFQSYPYSTSSNTQLYIGTPAENAYAFKGNVYETRLWNKTLSATDVKNNLFTDFTSGTTGLIGYWRFYNFTTLTAYDQTGNGRDAYLKNMTQKALNLRTSRKTNSSLELTWDKIEPSETFTLQKDATTVLSNVTSATYASSGLPDSSTYTFSLQAKNAYGQSIKEVTELATFATNPHINATPVDVTLPSVTLNGQKQTVSSHLTGTLDVSNFTAGTGWNVRVAATPFAMKDGKQYAFPKGSITLASPTSVAAIDGTATTTLPTLSTGTLAIDDGNSYKLLSMPVNGDIGSFSATFPANALEITLLPATARVDKETYPSGPTPYESTVTWTIASGP